MKPRLCIPIVGGLVLSVLTVELSADWTVDQPVDGEKYSTSSTIQVQGSGPQSTTAVAKLVRISSGIVQDTFSIETNDEEASFGGVFERTAAWSLGMHSIDIWVGPDQEYGDFPTHTDIEIADDP